MKLIQKIWRTSTLLLILGLAQQGWCAERIVRAQAMTIAPGQTNRMLILLESLGDESAVGFSIAFNTNLLRFVGAELGVDSTNVNASVPLVNLDEIATFGRVGVALGLDIFGGVTYPEGTNVIFEVLFTPVAGVTSGVSSVVFTNQPFDTALSDAEANDAPATFIGATVTIQPPCSYALNTNAAWFAAGGS